MNKYGPKARRIIAQTMEEYKEGRLYSGRSKELVKSRDQALAIGISKARKRHYKVPKQDS